MARASLDELLLDYEDFLRQRRLAQWAKDDPEAREVRALGSRTDGADPGEPRPGSNPYSRWVDSPDPALVANAVICLIHQTNYLLDRQINALERDFVSEGGYSERLAAARLARRAASDSSDHTAQGASAPSCPQCSRPMALRIARKGSRAGSQFCGCSGYPDCRGTQPAD